jgi:hypothetical protein
MKKMANNKIRITLDEARKIKSRSNLAQIIAEQMKEQKNEKNNEKDN